MPDSVNRLIAELYPICRLLALLGAHHILHVSRIKVKGVHVWRLNTKFALKIAENLNFISFTNTFDLNFCMHRSFSFWGVTAVLSVGGYTPWWFTV
jgi:hypothetical protein